MFMNRAINTISITLVLTFIENNNNQTESQCVYVKMRYNQPSIRIVLNLQKPLERLPMTPSAMVESYLLISSLDLWVVMKRQ